MRNLVTAIWQFYVEVFQCWGYPEGCPFFMADNSHKAFYYVLHPPSFLLPELFE